MAKKVSTDEKLQKIVDFFMNESEVFTLKELEKKLPKQCGFSAMLVKDLLQKAIDENLINVEKCGSTNLYWRFKYQKEHFYLCETEKAEISIQSYLEDNEILKSKIEKMIDNREDNSERTEIIKEYLELKEASKRIDELKEAIDLYSPEEYEKIKQNISELISKINKLTDDIFTLQSYACEKFNLERKVFSENFSVPEDLDYVECE